MIGTNLKKLREAKGYTLRKLGKMARLSHSFISDIEHGRGNPSIETLKKLAVALGESPDVFFKEVVAKNDLKAI